MLFYSFVVFILVSVLSSPSIGVNEIPGFAHYELLNMDQPFNKLIEEHHKRWKRSIDDGPVSLHDVNLPEKLLQTSFNISAYGINFQIRIVSSGNSVHQGLLTNDFQVFVVSGRGEKKKVKISLDRFFTGVLDNKDLQPSEVFGYLDQNGDAFLTINTPKETYSVEPLDKFKNDTEGTIDYIIYRASDLKLPSNSSFCGNDGKSTMGDLDLVSLRRKKDVENSGGFDYIDHDASRSYAQRQGSKVKDSCELCLVADYLFYDNVAHGDPSTATNYMVYLVSQVNNIYRSQGFEGPNGAQIRYGFTVKKIEVHEQATPSTANPSRRHYNADQALWDQGLLLESFSKTGEHYGCCLSHLFTHRPFEGGTLGLAYLANPNPYKIGGICSQTGSLNVNTGWSSTMFSDGSTVPSQQAVLVLAHELGHNWGSPHDLDTKECAPSSSYGGKYIMWMYSVAGYEKNNRHFSSCSIKAINEVLKAKADGCFKPKPDAICGNGFVEGNEECDAGPVGLRNEDHCCSSSCNLRFGAVCSDANEFCCKNCKPAPADTLCWSEQEMSQSSTCLGKAYCNGITAECQPRELLSDKPCFDNGQCRNGTCLPFCEVQGYKTCICDDPLTACNYCCFVNDTCQPLVLPGESKPKILADGRPCPFGSCKQGICQKSMMNTVEKMWSYFTEIEINNLTKFMKDNIVGVTIILALIVWIPLSCTVWCLDRRHERRLNQIYQKRERYPGELKERLSKVYYLQRLDHQQSFKIIPPTPPQVSDPSMSHVSSLPIYNRINSMSPSNLTAAPGGIPKRGGYSSNRLGPNY